MAESFNNFIAIGITGTEKTIIPSGVAGRNTSLVGTASNQGTNVRTVGSTVLVNGLYLTGNKADTEYVVSLMIRDDNYSSRPIYILNNIPIPANNSFFLERAITLLPNQYLTFIMPANKNTANEVVHATASSIEVID